MYFWRIENLKEDIRSGELSEKNRFVYALIYIVLFSLGMELSVYMPIENPSLWDYIDSSFAIIIVLVGTIFAYKANNGQSGGDFLGKYFAIGFVMSIRFLTYAIPMLICLIVYYSYAFPEDENVQTTYIESIPFIVWYTAMYWRIYVHIKQVN